MEALTNGLDLVMIIVTYSFYAVLIAFIIWMLVDAAKTDRFLWLLIMIGLPVIGGLIYYLTQKRHLIVPRKERGVSS